jgi:poly(3-hydroxybutyrate) depolymerase
MRKSDLLRLLLAGATAIVTAPGAPAQTVLSDYESADKAVQIRDSALWRLAFRPTLQVLQQSVAVLQNGKTASDAVKGEADALVAKSRNEPEAEARRDLWHAVTLLVGRAWGPDQDLLGSLVLRPDKPIAGSAGNLLTLNATYPAAVVPGTAFTLDLLSAEATSSATPRRGPMIKHLTSGKLDTASIRLMPDLGNVPEGFYIALATVTTPNGASTEIASPLYILHNLDARYAELKARLARVAGHPAAKETAEYPFALALAMNAGTREVISYDFPAAMRRSQAILDALAKGRDPVAHATGLQDRAYRFPESGEIIPYQIYVPHNWKPDRKWPLVVALHGANLDERNMLGRAGGLMQQLAERHGFIVVAPLGYRINSGYGSQRGMGGLLGRDDTRLRRSEQDVLAVTDLVAAEYGTEPRRTYLTGNSMGGGGTWWIGAQHPERWAAIAPAAFGGVTPADVAGLSKLPILAVVGDSDELGMADRVRAAVAILKAGGASPDYLEIKGGTHSTGFDIAMPQIFDFFAGHQK